MTDVSTTCAEAIFRVKCLLTLKLASAQVVETSVTNNSPYQDSNHPDDLFQSRHVTPGFKPFSSNYYYYFFFIFFLFLFFASFCFKIMFMQSGFRVFYMEK